MGPEGSDVTVGVGLRIGGSLLVLLIGKGQW